VTWEKKKVLVTVKTYPEHSQKHKTVVCTSGITEDGEWIRLYPIKIDTYTGRSKVRKYDWIEVECQKATDEYLKRKESYKVREGSVKILDNSLSSGKNKTPWAERSRLLLPHVAPSLEYLKEQYQTDRTSLGLIKPKEVLDFFTREPLTLPQEPREFQKSLFEDKIFPIIDSIPHIFAYKFNCAGCNDGKSHNIMCEDWELFELYRNLGQNTTDVKNLWEKIRQKYYDWMLKRDLYFYMGMYSLQPTWLIIGLYYPPKEILISVKKPVTLGNWMGT
jgi:hypothetical protein